MRLTILFIALLFLFSCAEPNSQNERLRAVVATQVEVDSGISQHMLSGITQSAETTRLSFEVSGVIERVSANLGDTINKGDVLATIDSKVYELAVKQRRGSLSEVLARLEESKRDLQRKQQLAASGAVSEAELDVAQTQLNSLRDQVDIARAQLDIALEELADTKLIAPFGGRVAERFIEPSQRVTPAQPVFAVEGETGIEVSVAVPENLVNKIQPGDTVSVTVFALKNQHLTGRVFEIGSRAQSANAFPVTVKLLDIPASLQPGMSAEVVFSYQSETKQGFRIPLGALISSDDHSHFVWVLQATEDTSVTIPVYRATRQPVSLVALESDHALIDGPLSDTMTIVSQGGQFLTPGQRVHIANQSPKLFNE